MVWSFDHRDEYQRKTVAVNLVKLIDSDRDLSTIVIDGNWGTGKTEFSLKLKNYIADEHPLKKVIYIDAFKEDHSSDPLLSVTAAIASALPEKKKQDLIKKAVPALRFAGSTALKAGVSWALKQGADTIVSDFQEVLKDTSDVVIENLIKSHIDAEESINALKTKIEELTKENKIIIIIDELDRCRPDYSINMLEKIKHIFEVENLYFILVTNLEQLKASVNHIYGDAVNAQSYLDKFIKFSLTLPETFKSGGHQTTHTSIAHWTDLVNCSLYHTDTCLEMEKQFLELLQIRPLSLRETETFFRHVNIYQTIASKKIGSNNSLAWNLTTITAIYLYCFCDKRSVTTFASFESIISFAKTLKINNLVFLGENTSDIPQYMFIFHGLMLKNRLLNADALGVSKKELDKIKKLYEEINSRNDWDFNVVKRMQDTFEAFSLT